jgi:hypothetical protein
VALAGVWCAAPRAAATQIRDGWLRQGIGAYEQLDYPIAAAVLRRGLAADAPGALPDSDRALALVYLGASELFRGRPDSAVAAFQRLVLLRPAFRPDPLTFPPEVTDLFRQVRRDTRAVAIELPRTTPIEVGHQRFAARLIASAYHTVDVVITFEDGRAVRLLYSGPIGDSLPVWWDGRDASGAIVAAGSYWLRVSSRTAGGAAVRFIEVRLDVRRIDRDTLALPSPPADSLLRPERWAAGPGLGALATGAVISGAVVALPTLVASGAQPSSARFVVAGAVSLTSVVAFVLRRPGRLIPENAQANRELRATWQRQVQAVRLENAERRQAVRLVIDAGPPHIFEATAP